MVCVGMGCNTVQFVPVRVLVGAMILRLCAEYKVMHGEDAQLCCSMGCNTVRLCAGMGCSNARLCAGMGRRMHGSVPVCVCNTTRFWAVEWTAGMGRGCRALCRKGLKKVALLCDGVGCNNGQIVGETVGLVGDDNWAELGS
jgi:hypothetical protein